MDFVGGKGVQNTERCRVRICEDQGVRDCPGGTSIGGLLQLVPGKSVMVGYQHVSTPRWDGWLGGS